MVYQMEKDEAFPLSWDGDIILKRPCHFSQEEYDQFFNKEMISLEDLNRYMSEPEYSIFHRVPVWVLKDEYKEKIKEEVLKGQKLSDEEGFPKWTLDFRARDERGDYWDFAELRLARQEGVVNWMLEPKNGICKGTTVGVASMNYNIQLSDPIQRNGELIGTLAFECSTPQECEYIYDGQTVCLNCEGPLPSKISQYEDELCNLIEEHCSEFLLSGLDDVIADAEEIQNDKPVSQFYIDDNYWER